MQQYTVDSTWSTAEPKQRVELAKGEQIVGKLVKVEPSNLYDGSFCITIENDNGLQILFTNNIPVDIIAEHKIAKDDLIAITYTGDKLNVKGENSYKMYEVAYKRASN